MAALSGCSACASRKGGGGVGEGCKHKQCADWPCGALLLDYGCGLFFLRKALSKMSV